MTLSREKPNRRAMHPVAKQVVLLRRYLLLAVRTQSEYAAGIWAAFGDIALSTASTLVYWNAITLYAPSVYGWDFPSLAILVAFQSFSFGSGSALWGLKTIPDHVVSGTLDVYMSKPINPIYAVTMGSLSTVGLFGIHEVVCGAGIVAITCSRFHIAVEMPRLAAALLCAALAGLTLKGVEACLYLASLWVGPVDSLAQSADTIWSFGAQPIDVFPGTVRHFLTFVLPVAFSATFPARIFLGRLSNPGPTLCVLAVLCAGWWGVASLVWRKGRSHYQSGGG